ncbi:MAG TPA: aminoglycoside phosphotransferase family protein [Solirubrobacterales bacterium]|nr:aminoglycoside phosphotransferase family protein [Solirubrobacterales bacterium]
MESGLIEQRALRAACAVARAHGVAREGAAVAYSGSNVLVHLRPSPVVARVMTGTVVLHEDPEAWLKREVSVLSFLAPSGLAVAPSPLISPGPYQSDGLWMTFWEWVAHRGSELRDGAERLGRALRELHDELSAFPGELAGFGDLQQDVDRLLRQLRPTAALAAQRIDSLRARLFDLSDTVFAAPLPAQALHGDASLSNLLCGGERLVWNDFEDTFRGPVHWDLAGYLISLEARGANPDFVDRTLEAYGGVDKRELAPFTAAHHVYDEIWGLYDAQRRS